MMFLVRLIDLIVRAVRYLATPEARLMRTGLVVVVIGGAMIGAAGLFWLLAQLPTLFAGAAAP